MFNPDDTNWILKDVKQISAFENKPNPIKPNGAFTTPMLKKDNFVPPVIEKKEDWLDIDDDAF